jgi:hypothetical protein
VRLLPGTPFTPLYLLVHTRQDVMVVGVVLRSPSSGSLMQPRMGSFLCLKRSLAFRSSTRSSESLRQQTFSTSTYFKRFQMPSLKLKCISGGTFFHRIHWP